MAKNNAVLQIANRQYQEVLEPKGEAYVRQLKLEDEFELMTEATVYTKKGATYITYEESEETGLENSTTMIKVSENAVDIRRYGESHSPDMNLHLEKGIKAITAYHVPTGRFEVSIYTNDLSHELDENGCGTVFADYNLQMMDLLKRRNRLEISIRPS